MYWLACRIFSSVGHSPCQLVRNFQMLHHTELRAMDGAAGYRSSSSPWGLTPQHRWCDFYLPLCPVGNCGSKTSVA